MESLNFPNLAPEIKSPKPGSGTTLWPSHCSSTPNPHICGGQDRPSAWSKQTASPSRTTQNARQITQIRMPPQIFRQNLLPRSNLSPLISARARMEPSVQEPITKNRGQNNPNPSHKPRICAHRTENLHSNQPQNASDKETNLDRFPEPRKTQSSATPKTPQDQSFVATVATRGISSYVGRPPIVKSTAIQQGLG